MLHQIFQLIFGYIVIDGVIKAAHGVWRWREKRRIEKRIRKLNEEPKTGLTFADYLAGRRMQRDPFQRTDIMPVTLWWNSVTGRRRN